MRGMSSQFAEYASRRRRFWLTALAFLPIAATALVLIGGGAYFRIDGKPWAGLAATVVGSALIAWLVKAAVAWHRLSSWPCPQCNKSFVVAWWSSWPTDECKHCGAKVDRP